MYFPDDVLAVLIGNNAGFRHPPMLGATPSARAMRAVADDAEDARAEHPIDAQHPYGTNDDAMPEHDPDGTPWAA